MQTDNAPMTYFLAWYEVWYESARKSRRRGLTQDNLVGRLLAILLTALMLSEVGGAQVIKQKERLNDISTLPISVLTLLSKGSARSGGRAS